jgi:hypothetical protein
VINRENQMRMRARAHLPPCYPVPPNLLVSGFLSFEHEGLDVTVGSTWVRSKA